MAQLADRIAFLTTRYGSDPAAWQHEIAALAALEQSDAKAAIERFHALKRRLVEFRRAQLFRELRAFPFVEGVPGGDTTGYPLKELEADVRDATRALALARTIAEAQRETAEALASLRHRATPAPAATSAPAATPAPAASGATPHPTPPAARWDALAPLAEAAEDARRAAMREARLERRFAAAARRSSHLALRPVVLPDPRADAGALDAALAEAERALDAAERLDEAFRAATAPLKAPEVATFRHESRKAIEREARALAEASDLAALEALAARAESLRTECAKLASEAARSRRAGRTGPERERRSSDTMDGYG